MATQFPLTANGTSPCHHVLCCYSAEDAVASFTLFALTKCLLSFPPCVSVLCVALHRWWQQRSASTPGATSPADLLTYHIAVMTLIGVFGSLAICGGIHVSDYYLIALGFCCWSLAWYGEISFHTLTCLERYFATVHPIHYLKLKRGGGVFIRHISIVCAWLICILKAVTIQLRKTSIILISLEHTLALVIASFCSASVFCILIRPIPGHQRRDGGDRTKQRAFIIIITSLWILILRICWNFVLSVFTLSPHLLSCVAIYLGIWLTALSSLVAPLLFLHRAGKLACAQEANC